MEISFSGGVCEVGRSCVLLKSEDTRILLDCGIKLGERTKYPSLDHVKGVDAVILTHAHIDHIGALPLLFSMDKRSPDFEGIFCTPPTVALSHVMLRDGWKLQQVEWERFNLPKLYDYEDLVECLNNFKAVNYHSSFDVEDFTFTFFESGHVLGSCLVKIESHEGTLVYTGDIGGFYRSNHLNPPETGVRCDWLIMESTYGATLQHPAIRQVQNNLIEIIRNYFEEHPTGKILIPAFAFARSQELMRLFSLRNLPYPVYYDGMIKDTQPVYDAHVAYMNEEVKNQFYQTRQNPFLGNFTPIETMEQRWSVIRDKKPAIILAPSGMLNGGWSPFYFSKLNRPENLLILVSYQAEGTPGRLIRDGERKVTITLLNDDYEWSDEQLDVKIGVASIEGLTAHASANDLRTFARSCKPEKIFLVHGEAKEVEYLSQMLKKDKILKDAEVVVPQIEKGYELKVEMVGKDVLKRIIERLDSLEERISRIENKLEE
ncbi:MAG: MBL fold metallo-hydrolase [Candidatus Jordarchaeum sp.]|uniref:MBL fold metallo-hydrolase n=1 Tax=Candidatus Jordarchaeum sp. TaxID=2823881 RepID=UPI00404A63E0